MHREHQNARARVELRDERGGFQSAHHRHRDVEDDDVGAELPNSFNGILTVRRLS
jgi:hypothetical protein